MDKCIEETKIICMILWLLRVKFTTYKGGPLLVALNYYYYCAFLTIVTKSTTPRNILYRLPL